MLQSVWLNIQNEIPLFDKSRTVAKANILSFIS